MSVDRIGSSDENEGPTVSLEPLELPGGLGRCQHMVVGRSQVFFSSALSLVETEGTIFFTPGVKDIFDSTMIEGLLSFFAETNTASYLKIVEQKFQQHPDWQKEVKRKNG